MMTDDNVDDGFIFELLPRTFTYHQTRRELTERGWGTEVGGEQNLADVDGYTRIVPETPISDFYNHLISLRHRKDLQRR